MRLTQNIGPILDLITGVYACVGILAAVAQREVTGRGDHVDLGMLDVQVSLLANQAMNYLMSGKTPVRTGTSSTLPFFSTLKPTPATT